MPYSIPSQIGSNIQLGIGIIPKARGEPVKGDERMQYAPISVAMSPLAPIQGTPIASK